MLRKQSKRYRLERNKKSFSKMKIDYYRYVKDFYLEDGLAYISCNVRDYHDIIDIYSVDGYEWLNEDFARFVESNAEYIPVEYPIVLEICGKEFTDAQKAVINETIHDYYELKLGDKQMDMQNNTSQIITFLAIGVIATAIMLALQIWSADSFINDMIVILVWFFIWELCGLIIYDRSDLKEEKMAAAQLASITVRYKVEFTDTAVSEKEKARIYESIEEQV
ncbi:MAG: hypothetical protein IIY33_02660 [Erysipelotrichaceae bacterium]|nr:hypothetical protein [Erysipelotrichaceae bacterium]MBQ1523314.1 hypothetical protein [Erysipelotrichaceae bacterium]